MEQRDPKAVIPSPEAQIHMEQEGSTSNQLTEKYELLEVLGVGSTSTCYRAIKRSTGESFACKMIDKTFVASHYQGMFEQFQCEIMALKNLHHSNIIRLYDVYITSDKIYIVMELMKGGELFDYVVQRGTLKEYEASDIMLKVTSALVYMHSKKIIHRDLKPENLLLKTKPLTSKDIDVKIIDFGLCKTLEEPLAKSFLGTRGYLAPEMLQRKNYSSAVDTWALGVIMYVLLCGCLPFDDDSQPLSSPQIRTKFVIRYPRWASGLSADAKDLLSHLLDIDPYTRYTAEDAISHPWMSKTPCKVASSGSLSGLENEDVGDLTFDNNTKQGKNNRHIPPTHTNTTGINNNRHRIYSDTTYNHYQPKTSFDDSSHSKGSGGSKNNGRRVHRVPYHKKRSIDI